MKMFRSDQRKDHRRGLTDEERAELEAQGRTSPGKVSGTMRLVYALQDVARDEAGDDAKAGISAGAADSVARRQWAGPDLDDGALFGGTRSDDRDGPMLGTGWEAMAHLAWPAGMESVRAASLGGAARALSAPIQGKGIDELPEPSALRLETTGSGEKLPEEVRAKMEAALGMDFSGVRIHVGEQAPSVGALAFTRGTDIFFAPGRYQPESQRGQELLGHELAHVVQQSQGRVGGSTNVGGVTVNDDVALEREADQLGARAAGSWSPAAPRGPVTRTSRQSLAIPNVSALVAQRKEDETEGKVPKRGGETALFWRFLSRRAAADADVKGASKSYERALKAVPEEQRAKVDALIGRTVQNLGKRDRAQLVQNFKNKTKDDSKAPNKDHVRNKKQDDSKALGGKNAGHFVPRALGLKGALATPEGGVDSILNLRVDDAHSNQRTKGAMEKFLNRRMDALSAEGMDPKEAIRQALAEYKARPYTGARHGTQKDHNEDDRALKARTEELIAGGMNGNKAYRQAVLEARKTKKDEAERKRLGQDSSIESKNEPASVSKVAKTLTPGVAVETENRLAPNAETTQENESPSDTENTKQSTSAPDPKAEEEFYALTAPPQPDTESVADQPAAEKPKVEKTLTKKTSVSVGHDFTPEVIQQWNDSFKAEAAKYREQIRAVCQQYLGSVAPNKVELSLVIKVADVAADKESEQTKDLDSGQTTTKEGPAKMSITGVSISANAKIGWEWKLSELLAGKLGDDWNRISRDWTVFGQTLALEGSFDAGIFLGAKGQLSISVSLGEAITEKLDTLLQSIGRTSAESAEAQAEAKGTQVASQAQNSNKPADVGKTEDKQPKSLASAGVSGDLFIGAKASVGVSAAARWKKPDDFSQVSTSLEQLGDKMGGVNWGWVLGKIGSGVEALMGSGGEVDLLIVEVEAAGQAGASLGGKLEVSLAGGKLEFSMSGSATLGLGGSLETSITADPVELARFMLLAGGAAISELYRYVADTIPELMSSLLDGLWSSFFADDLVREGVKNGLHKAADASKRARMVQDCLDGWTSDDDEDAILTILEFSQQKGDLAAVLNQITNISQLHSDINGSEGKRLAQLMGSLVADGTMWFETELDRGFWGDLETEGAYEQFVRGGATFGKFRTLEEASEVSANGVIKLRGH